MSGLDMYGIIDKKKNKGTLSAEEIRYFINGVTDSTIPDYQTAALLMAIVLNGMDDEETSVLTDAMMTSGDVLDLSSLPGIKADKHSTGGVGDKTSLVLEPIMAACGLTIPKMSGRGLGHTGGTVDKLESIPGMKMEYSPDEFLAIAAESGIIIASQSADIAPADKKLYALRDVTATVDSIPLIASSIMSKKLACGADVIVLDVKTGSGAFMDSYEGAKTLAEKMVSIGKRAGRKISAVITDMDQPLGRAVGNALEVKEAIETLKGNGPSDLEELCLGLGAEELLIAGKAGSREAAEAMIREAVTSGRAAAKLAAMISAQGGNADVIENTDLLPKALFEKRVFADRAGYIARLGCREVGMASLLTGAGRKQKDDAIDLAAGLVLNKKVGDRVDKGELLATLYSSSENLLDPAAERLLGAYVISDEKPSARKLIYEVIK
ncbi:MAG: thymidine phosphorylase [Eubacteriaceae bacterium]|nr:thymidine phosphorylase [Eubacteriaceae bacterium]